MGIRGEKLSEENEDLNNIFDGRTEQRINLNDLLKRAKDQAKEDKKINYLIISGVAAIAAVVLLILSF
mgnify:FL=1